MTSPAGDEPGGDRAMAADDWEVIDGDDVVGTASARLLSTCADRAERLAALSLLGLLLDHADEAGRVRLPLDALARELDAEADRTVRLLQRLVAVEAVHAEGDAVVVAGAQPREHALKPSRFLANLMTVLEREPPGSPPRRTGVPGRSPAAVDRPAPRPRHRVLVALGVAVVAMALATAPSGDPATTLRTVSPPDAPTGRAPWATFLPTPTPTVPGTVEGGVATGDDLGPGGDDEPAVAGSPVDDGSPAGSGHPDGATDEPPAPGTGGSDAEPSPSAPPPTPEGATGRPSAPGRPPASGTAGGPSTPDPGEACPVGVPEATVAGTQLLGIGPSSVLDIVGERVLLVTGTVVNTSNAAVIIAEVEVESGQGTDREVELVGTVPVDIAPGGTAGWEARLLAGVTLPSQAPVGARVTEWSWGDPGLAARCPS